MQRIGIVGIAGILAAVFFTSASAHEINLRKLPLGDGKISKAPRPGWIWACHTNPMGGGAHRVGPWIDLKARTYDLTAKVAVRGAVRWPHSFIVTREGNKRVLTSNDFPDHPTGTFPIARDDPAYQYDRNPNRSAPDCIELRQSVPRGQWRRCGGIC